MAKDNQNKFITILSGGNTKKMKIIITNKFK